MPSIKKSVMFSEATLQYIAARTKGGYDEISWSQALNEGFKALKWLTDQALPDLTPDEWQMILNAYAGTLIEFSPPFRVASDMMDDAGVIALEDLDSDRAALVRKVHSMSQLEQFAILDFVQKFWANDWSNCANFTETIKRATAL